VPRLAAQLRAVFCALAGQFKREADRSYHNTMQCVKGPVYSGLRNREIEGFVTEITPQRLAAPIS
jgi:hypothetical protein